MRPDPGPSALHSVLVVEDSDDDFDTITIAAQRADGPNRLVRASGVEGAWQLLLRERPEHFCFVLLDYNLWGFEGLVLLDQIRQHPLLAHLPVVVFTTTVNPSDRQKLSQAGATAFHLKSVEFPNCLHTLDAIFARWLYGTATSAPPPMSRNERRPA